MKNKKEIGECKKEELLVAGEDLYYGQRLANINGIVKGYKDDWQDDRELWQIYGEGCRNEKVYINTLRNLENLKIITKRTQLYHDLNS